MSGYGGRPPSDWQGPSGQHPSGQNPYGQNPYGQHPYGQNPYGQNPYGHNPYGAPAGYGGADPYAYDAAAYGPPGFPRTPPASNAAAVAAIIGNCVGLIFVCGIGIAWLPGLILGGVAVNKIQSDPAAARSLTRGSWICCGLNFVIEAVIFLVWYLGTH
ncbi:MAG TPA: hypothetical protein VF069_21135 [Streptosporangiaceae bacterium]